jgi:hypothetical protein
LLKGLLDRIGSAPAGDVLVFVQKRSADPER